MIRRCKRVGETLGRTDQSERTSCQAQASILPANFFQTDMARLRSRFRSSLEPWPAEPGALTPPANPAPEPRRQAHDRRKRFWENELSQVMTCHQPRRPRRLSW